jgi:membrane protein
LTPMTQRFTLYKEIIQDTFREFSNDKAMKLSASLAYYTIFSLSPMLIVIISLCGIFFGKQAVEGEIYVQIREMVGSDAAIQIQEMIKNANLGKDNYLATGIGLGTLLLGATGVFAEIQDSINFIWGVKPKPKKGFLKVLINRLLSFSIVVSMGFVLMVSLAVNGIMTAFSTKITRFFPDFSIGLAEILSFGFTFIIITLLFAVIFKVLPDVKIRWKDVLVGSVVTALLFLLGKFLIGLYLSMSNLGFTYGAAASIIIILLWVYYSSIILYFGAEFTQAYAERLGGKIVPKEYAVLVKQREITQEDLLKEDNV